AIAHITCFHVHSSGGDLRVPIRVICSLPSEPSKKRGKKRGRCGDGNRLGVVRRTPRHQEGGHATEESDHQCERRLRNRAWSCPLSLSSQLTWRQVADGDAERSRIRREESAS